MRLRWIARLMLALGLLGPLPATAEEVSLTVNGHKANALWEPVANPLGVVLLVHGSMAHNDMELMRDLRSALHDRGFSTLAPTLTLGQDDRHGMLSCKGTHNHGHNDAIAEIAAWVDWAHQEQGVDSLILLGHSRGGNQVAQYAVTHDTPVVAQLVLMAPMTWDQEKVAAVYEQATGTALDAVLATAREKVAAGEPDAVLEDVRYLHCPEADATAASFLAYYGPDPRRDTPALVEAFTRPTLILVGAEDRVVPDLMPRLDHLEPGSTVTFDVIEGAGHMFLDFFTQDAADLIEAFIVGER